MREIKFKFWNTYLKTWEMAEYMVGKNGFLKLRCVPCQFTGLKDKNGKEIYEGDIVQEESGGCNFVEWSEIHGGWSTNQWFYGAELVTNIQELEVIGNIHENPDLLK